MMSGTMIVGGDVAGVAPTSVRTGPGLEFLPGVLIDMHFAERGRLNRLLSRGRALPARARPGHRRGHRDPRRRRRASRCSAAASVTVVDAGCAHRHPGPARRARSRSPARASTCCPPDMRFDLTGRRPSPAECRCRGTGTSRMKITSISPPARPERVPVPAGRGRPATPGRADRPGDVDVTGFTERLLRALPGPGRAPLRRRRAGRVRQPAARRHLLRARHRARVHRAVPADRPGRQLRPDGVGRRARAATT